MCHWYCIYSAKWYISNHVQTFDHTKVCYPFRQGYINAYGGTHNIFLHNFPIIFKFFKKYNIDSIVENELQHNHLKSLYFCFLKTYCFILCMCNIALGCFRDICINIVFSYYDQCDCIEMIIFLLFI